MNDMQPQDPSEIEQEQVPWTPLDLLKAIGLVLGITIILLGIIVVFLVLASPDIDLEKDMWLILVLAGIPMYGAMLLSIWLLSIRKYRIPWRFLGLRRFSVTRGVFMALGVVGAGIVVGILYDLLLQALGRDPVSTLPEQFTATAANWAVLAFFAVVAAPVFEELFFRGFIFPGISKQWGYGWGMLASAVLFSLVHMEPSALVPIFILGLLLAWLYKATGSIWPCILTHCTYNSIVLLVAAIA
jgi:membrane protease YdiL (CAAX protease family)